MTNTVDRILGEMETRMKSNGRYLTDVIRDAEEAISPTALAAFLKEHDGWLDEYELREDAKSRQQAQAILQSWGKDLSPNYKTSLSGRQGRDGRTWSQAGDVWSESLMRLATRRVSKKRRVRPWELLSNSSNNTGPSEPKKERDLRLSLVVADPKVLTLLEHASSNGPSLPAAKKPKLTSEETPLGGLISSLIGYLKVLGKGPVQEGALTAFTIACNQTIGSEIASVSKLSSDEACLFGSFIGSILTVADEIRTTNWKQFSKAGWSQKAYVQMLRFFHHNLTAGCAKSLKSGDKSLEFLSCLMKAAPNFPTIESHGNLLMKQLKKFTGRKVLSANLTKPLLASLESKTYISDTEFRAT